MHTNIPAVLLTLSLPLLVLGCATTEKPKATQQPAVAFEKPILRPVENPMPPNPPGVYDVSKVTVSPVPTFQARPRYPSDLRRAGSGGEGVVSFIVGIDGTVGDVTIVRATDIRFGESAAEAVLKWRFRPAQLKGAVVRCHMMVPIVFTSNDE